MKVLVTGAPGWLGTRLVEMLRQKGRDVVCVVLPGFNDSYLKGIGANTVIADLSRPESIRNICDSVQTVFHCAGVVHPKAIRELYNVNVDGTKNILEEAVRSKVKRFIHVSSNSVAGANTSRDKLMKEEDPPSPYMNYGLSKYKAEELVLKARMEGKIESVAIRPCWFYGIRQPDRQTTFFRMIKKGDPIVFGDGKNLRSMSYIDNVVDALFLAEEKERAAGNVYWIADERPYMTIEIYNTIARLLGVKGF